MRASQLFDLLAMSVVLIAASLVASSTVDASTLAQFLAIRIKVQNVVLFAALLFGWHLIFVRLGLYRSRRLGAAWREYVDVLAAVAWCTLLLAASAFVFRFDFAEPKMLGMFFLIAAHVLVTSRLVIRMVLASARRRGHNLRHVLIVGTGARAVTFAQRLENSPELGYRIIGFVDEEWSGIETARRSGYAVVASLTEIDRVLRDTVVDEVVLALPMCSHYTDASRVVELCEEQGIIVRVLADLFTVRRTYGSAATADTDSIITLNAGVMDDARLLVKRAIDIVLSATLLIILAPVMALIALAIRLDSPGPVFFRQVRRGLNKRPFTMLKFRTMGVGADRALDTVAHLSVNLGPGFKIRNDPRVTRFGALLRRTSLDELPQLLNILAGEMSLVGPRPLFEWEYNRISEPGIKRRCSVRPGLTGLWQVSGRSDVPFARRIELDLQYIDNWSLALDIQILLKTVPTVVLGRGAV